MLQTGFKNFVTDQGQLFKKNLGAKEINLPIVLEETRVFDKDLGMLVNYACFHEKRYTRKWRLKQKSCRKETGHSSSHANFQTKCPSQQTCPKV